ncbi:MAG TPA: site-specific integrase [Pantanalinema sp.]
MARRGRNEGHITKRQDGRWMGVLHLGYEGGKRRRKHFYGKTRAEVSAQLVKAQRDLQLGIKPADGTTTVEQFLDRWLATTAKPKVRPSTFARYAALVRLHIAPQLGNVKLAKLTAEQVQRFMNDKQAAGLSPRTVQYIRAVLFQALKQAVDWDVIGRNVVERTKSPKLPHKEVTPLSKSQVLTFLESIKGDRLEVLYSLVVATGLRQGEALGLTWDDVDFQAGVIRIRNNLQWIEGQFKLVDVKTARSRRTLAVPDVIMKSLKQHRAKQAAEKLRSGAAWKDTLKLVFTTPTGAPIHASNITHHFQRLLADLGLPRQRFHDLRHCCASLLIAENTNMKLVSDHLGHSQIGITMDLYAHVLPDTKREVAKTMNSILTGNH